MLFKMYEKKMPGFFQYHHFLHYPQKVMIIANIFLSTYKVPGTILSTLYTLTYLILKTILR